MNCELKRQRQMKTPCRGTQEGLVFSTLVLMLQNFIDFYAFVWGGAPIY